MYHDEFCQLFFPSPLYPEFPSITHQEPAGSSEIITMGYLWVAGCTYVVYTDESSISGSDSTKYLKYIFNTLLFHFISNKLTNTII